MSAVGNASTDVASHEVAFAEVPSKRGFIASQNVCLAGAPLFEGRWIPDAGEIISPRLFADAIWNVNDKEKP